MLRARSLWIFAAVALIATATRLLLTPRPEITAAEQTVVAAEPVAKPTPTEVKPQPLLPGQETYLGLIRLPAGAVFIHSSAVTASGKLVPHYGYLTAAGTGELIDYFDAELRGQGWERIPATGLDSLNFTRGDARIAVAVSEGSFLISGPYTP